jgi:predicted CXXCH cytochrome family protein
MRLKITVTITSILLLTAAIASAQNFETVSYDCLDCHRQYFSNMPTHFIEGNLDCLFCHDVPATATNDSVMENHAVDTYVSNLLCQSCHVDIDNSGWLSKHNEFNCINCHDAHGSNIEHALVKEPVSLCRENCHAIHELGISHPVGDEIVDQNHESELTCVSSCHSNHQPREEKMLRLAEGDLCTTCHNGY